MKRALLVFFLILLTACVDRINFDVGDAGDLPVVIEGHITSDPGPYEVRVTRGFDVESKFSIKTRLQVKKMEILDDEGNVEQLSKIDDGIYRTKAEGFRGVVGRTYKIKVELLDGRIYESIPDKMLPSGSVDQIQSELVSYVDANNFTKFGFDIYFDSKAGTQSYQLMWKMVATYQVTTNPELATESCGESRCPTPPACSGYILGPVGEMEYVGPCQCCNCWVNIFNDVPVVSDGKLVQDGKFHHIKIGQVPITAFTFMYKTHVEIQQYSLSENAFDFWNGIKTQMGSAGNLFQPQTGGIHGNFVQVAGTPGPVQGIFYASSISRTSIFLSQADIPDKRIIPVQAIPLTRSCLTFPNSTNVEPSYWRP